MNAFFEESGDGRYLASPLTSGPWDPRMQHGGPISALLARLLADVDPIPGQRLARATFELLGPVPIGPFDVERRVARAGKRVSLAEAVVRDPDGKELMLARGWRIQPTPFEVESTLGAATLPDPKGRPRTRRSFAEDPTGFLAGIEVRFTKSGFSEPGPGAAWFRLVAPLVEGTPWRPTDPVFCAADCANGVSGALDFRRYVYINPDLTVHLQRDPRGEWVGLDAETVLSPGGVTVASGTLQDAGGLIGHTRQTLFVSSR